MGAQNTAISARAAGTITVAEEGAVILDENRIGEKRERKEEEETEGFDNSRQLRFELAHA